MSEKNLKFLSYLFTYIIGPISQILLLISIGEEESAENDTNEDFNLEDEVLHFGTNCSNCNAPCETNMKVTCKLKILSFI